MFGIEVVVEYIREFGFFTNFSMLFFYRIFKLHLWPLILKF